MDKLVSLVFKLETSINSVLHAKLLVHIEDELDKINFSNLL